MRKTKSWRTADDSRPTPGIINDPTRYPATRFFDNLSFIGTRGACCFLLETSAGLVLLDCINPGQPFIDMIETGIRELGYRPEELIAIMITHGHGDHWGESSYLKKKYGCKLYMNEVDYRNAQNLPDRAPWKNYDGELDGYLEDMGVYTFGDTAVTTVHTPGHTPGSMSFLVPVTDEGRPHMLSIWDGSGVKTPDADIDAYLASVEKYKKICKEYHVDCSAQTHPFIDNGIQKLELVRTIARGVQNPFLIGEEGNEYFLNAMKESAEREKIIRAQRAAQKA